MRKLNIFVFAVSLAMCLVIFLSTNIQDNRKSMEEGMPNPQLIFNLSSNKEIYHSSDEMQLTLTIKASMNIENLTIKIRGVKDRFGHYRIKTEKVINLTEPESTEIFNFRVPSCYGCAGVSPGEYKIVTEILKNGELIGNLSKTIKLEK